MGVAWTFCCLGYRMQLQAAFNRLCLDLISTLGLLHACAAAPGLQVGESGHGKSTIIGLLERFYAPVDGTVRAALQLVPQPRPRWGWLASEAAPTYDSCYACSSAEAITCHSFYPPPGSPLCLAAQVLVDGIDISNLSVKHLRSQIGLVGQEPVMFR